MSALGFLIRLSIVSSLWAGPLLAQGNDSTPVPVAGSAPPPVADNGAVPVAGSAPPPVADNGPVPLAGSAPPPVAENRPVPVAEGTPGTISVGYSYLNMNVGGEPTANLYGIATSGTINFLPRWRGTVDASYGRAARDPGSGHSSYVLSVLAGPVFVPKQKGDTRLLVRALGGVSVVDSSVRVNELYYRGWLAHFSWAIGTGIEHQLSPFALRFNVDYLRTKFMGSSGVVRPQNGIRFTASIVFRFGPRETEPRASRKP